MHVQQIPNVKNVIKKSLNIRKNIKYKIEKYMKL